MDFGPVLPAHALPAFLIIRAYHLRRVDADELEAPGKLDEEAMRQVADWRRGRIPIIDVIGPKEQGAAIKPAPRA